MKERDYTEGTNIRNPGGYVQRTLSPRPLHTKPATFSHSTTSACSEAAEYNGFSYTLITVISCISIFFLLRQNHKILCLPQRRSSSTPETRRCIKNWTKVCHSLSHLHVHSVTHLLNIYQAWWQDLEKWEVAPELKISESEKKEQGRSSPGLHDKLSYWMDFFQLKNNFPTHFS